jgi:UDP-N-acetylglucosamine 1-carboxyvinyltransferase
VDKIIIRGGKQLSGSVHIEGAKNAVLPIMAAAILVDDGVSLLENVPLLSDVYTMKSVLKFLNVKIDFDMNNHRMVLDATGPLSYEAPLDYVSKMRASILVMGALLARLGHVKVALPGGCAIGSRPIDIHLKGLKMLGASINNHEGYVEAFAPNGLHGAKIYMDFPSVGATQNLMMAATLAEGTTILENVAEEPEIVDLANMLNEMGAIVLGAGTSKIKIKGVTKLCGVKHAIIQDRIEAGTFMVAAALTKGNVLIEDADWNYNQSLIAKMREMGVTVIQENDGIRVIGPDKLHATDVKTLPYPGFPTDMQPQMSILQLRADSNSLLTETVFENRFMHLDELSRMNAKFRINSRSAVLQGSTVFSGAEVSATDLRAAAALVLAGLVAEGKTTVTNLKYLDRGYYDFHIKLAKLGADIKRINI